jgi:hypothetical protein
MSKADELFGLHKIPDRELISHLLLERGKNLAYIEELEEELGKHGGCAKCKAKDELIKNLEAKNRKLKSKEDKREDSFEKMYYDLLKKYERIEKYLFETAKSKLT